MAVDRDRKRPLTWLRKRRSNYNKRDGRVRTYFVGIEVARRSIPPMSEL
jgi:hypothetical protein